MDQVSDGKCRGLARAIDYCTVGSSERSTSGWASTSLSSDEQRFRPIVVFGRRSCEIQPAMFLSEARLSCCIISRAGMQDVYTKLRSLEFHRLVRSATGPFPASTAHCNHAYLCFRLLAIISLHIFRINRPQLGQYFCLHCLAPKEEYSWAGSSIVEEVGWSSHALFILGKRRSWQNDCA